MKYVYLLQSLRNRRRRYVGITSNLRRRLAEHNSGKSPHTSKYGPWKVVVTIRFDDDARAAQFEKYVKTGSGHAFANRHFW